VILAIRRYLNSPSGQLLVGYLLASVGLSILQVAGKQLQEQSGLLSVQIGGQRAELTRLRHLAGQRRAELAEILREKGAAIEAAGDVDDQGADVERPGLLDELDAAATVMGIRDELTVDDVRTRTEE
jgi:hypothetical protein